MISIIPGELSIAWIRGVGVDLLVGDLRSVQVNAPVPQQLSRIRLLVFRGGERVRMCLATAFVAPPCLRS